MTVRTVVNVRITRTLLKCSRKFIKAGKTNQVSMLTKSRNVAIQMNLRSDKKHSSILRANAEAWVPKSQQTYSWILKERRRRNVASSDTSICILKPTSNIEVTHVTHKLKIITKPSSSISERYGDQWAERARAFVAATKDSNKHRASSSTTSTSSRNLRSDKHMWHDILKLRPTYAQEPTYEAKPATAHVKPVPSKNDLSENDVERGLQALLLNEESVIQTMLSLDFPWRIQGGKALHLACESAIPHVVRACLVSGLDANTRGPRKRTPLHLVMSRGDRGTERADIAILLLDHGAAACARDNAGDTALHCAARSGSVDAAIAVCSKLRPAKRPGSQNYLHITNHKGELPLELAVKSAKAMEITSAFLSAGAKPFQLRREGVYFGPVRVTCSHARPKLLEKILVRSRQHFLAADFKKSWELDPKNLIVEGIRLGWDTKCLELLLDLGPWGREDIADPHVGRRQLGSVEELRQGRHDVVELLCSHRLELVSCTAVYAHALEGAMPLTFNAEHRMYKEGAFASKRDKRKPVFDEVGHCNAHMRCVVIIAESQPHCFKIPPVAGLIAWLRKFMRWYKMRPEGWPKESLDECHAVIRNMLPLLCLPSQSLHAHFPPHVLLCSAHTEMLVKELSAIGYLNSTSEVPETVPMPPNNVDGQGRHVCLRGFSNDVMEGACVDVIVQEGLLCDAFPFFQGYLSFLELSHGKDSEDPLCLTGITPLTLRTLVDWCHSGRYASTDVGMYDVSHATHKGRRGMRDGESARGNENGENECGSFGFHLHANSAPEEVTLCLDVLSTALFLQGHALVRIAGQALVGWLRSLSPESFHDDGRGQDKRVEGQARQESTDAGHRLHGDHPDCRAHERCTGVQNAANVIFATPLELYDESFQAVYIQFCSELLRLSLLEGTAAASVGAFYKHGEWPQGSGANTAVGIVDILMRRTM